MTLPLDQCSVLRQHALSIWQAAVAAVRPEELVREALEQTTSPLRAELERARRILVVGAGKAGAALSAGVEQALPHLRDRLTGVVNVPAAASLSASGQTPVVQTARLQGHAGEPPASRSARQLDTIRLHVARPAGTNQPTAAGVAGSEEILARVSQAGSEDVCLCLLSGGGSALLPAPVAPVTLEDKQAVTRLLHACGATINEMNAVRKHLSRIKGGRLAEAFTGRALFSLIISDVIGDPLDVIASGPTAPDASTFADARAVLTKYQLDDRAPTSVVNHLERGCRGESAETPKALPPHIHNVILGNNARALRVAEDAARSLGYPVLNLGSFLEGETRHVATALAGVVRSMVADGKPLHPPVCLLSGGETTVTLTPEHGLGGRNQEFVLAAALKLGDVGLARAVVLSGGTDGEDGPTDAAGAVADAGTLARARLHGLDAEAFLARNDAYHFFAATGDLLRTGLTETNVMDVRVLLVV